MALKVKGWASLEQKQESTISVRLSVGVRMVEADMGRRGMNGAESAAVGKGTRMERNHLLRWELGIGRSSPQTFFKHPPTHLRPHNALFLGTFLTCLEMN